MASQTSQLVVRAGPGQGKIFELLQDEITIGRDIGNLVVINDPEVSRKHSRLKAQPGGGYTIEDLGSTNGTFVDGQRLMGPHALRNGEIIMLGEKISLAYEIVGFDAEATLVSSSGPQVTPVAPSPQIPRDTYRVMPAPAEAYPPRPPQTEVVPPPQSYQPAYSGQVPPGPAAPYTPSYEAPVEPYEETPFIEEPKKSRTWLYIGCILGVLIVCCLVAGAVTFDSLNLYCHAPFKALFNCP
jgi:pSer/pThr/pTyr-binding forkhead associated (FHA) protein